MKRSTEIKLRKLVERIIREEEIINLIDEVERRFIQNGYTTKEKTSKRLIMTKRTKADDFYILLEKDYMGKIGEWSVMCTAEVEVGEGRSLADPKARYQTTSARTGVKFKKIKDFNIFNDEKLVISMFDKYIRKINSTGKYNFI